MQNDSLLWPQGAKLLSLEALSALGGKAYPIGQKIELGLYWIVAATALILALENFYFSRQLAAGYMSLVVFGICAWQLFAHYVFPALKMPVLVALMGLASAQLYQITQRGLIPAMHYDVYVFLYYALLSVRLALLIGAAHLILIGVLLIWVFPSPLDPTILHRFFISELTTLLMVHVFTCVSIYLLNRLHDESRAKGRFLDAVSHELRTPLNGITGLVFCLRQEADNNANTRQYLDKLDMATHHLSGIIGDVLDLSRLEKNRLELHPKPTDLAKLTENVLSMLGDSAMQKNLTLALHNAKDLPARVLTDHQRLRQILFNYLSNALKFTHEGGVELHTRVLDRTENTARIRFSVKDTGIGIPPAAQARLFNMFEQAHASAKENYGGSGLGLSIVKGLTQAMDGQVGFRSIPEQGSEFWADIPFQITDEAEQIAQQPIDKHLLDNLQILIVDDAPLNILVAENMLKAYGARCKSAKNGQDALSALLANTGIDLVLMDVRMPVMDGLAATRAIRANKQLSKLPIIGLTGAAMLEDRNKALAAGMNELVTKPFNQRELLDKIKQLTLINSANNA
jgi:signal transduction histidine kinase/CheY-like chemotaxis protein